MQVQIWRCTRRDVSMHAYKVQPNPGVKKGWPSAGASGPSRPPRPVVFSHASSKVYLKHLRTPELHSSYNLQDGHFLIDAKTSKWVGTASIQSVIPSCKVWKWQCGEGKGGCLDYRWANEHANVPVKLYLQKQIAQIRPLGNSWLIPDVDPPGDVTDVV